MKTKKKQNYRRTLGDVLGHCAGSIDYYFPFLQQRKRKEKNKTAQKKKKKNIFNKRRKKHRREISSF
jgi:hypothetical protein